MKSSTPDHAELPIFQNLEELTEEQLDVEADRLSSRLVTIRNLRRIVRQRKRSEELRAEKQEGSR